MKQETMKKLIAMLLAVVMVLALAACGSTASSSSAGSTAGSTTASASPTVIKIGHANTEEHPTHQAFLKFKELLESGTDGRYMVEIYPNGQLGSDSDLLEATKQGSIQMANCVTSFIANYSPEFFVFDVPFAFLTEEDYDNFVYGELFQTLANAAEQDAGVILLGVWERGYREFTSNKAINSIDDVTGLRMRIMDNKLHQNYWNSIGVDAAPLAWGDTYVALQQGAMDAHDNPVGQILTSNIQDVQSHLAMLDHVISTAGLVINPAFFNSMSAEDQEVLRNAVVEAQKYNDELTRSGTADTVAKLEELGMTVTYPDTAPFIAAADALSDSFAADFPEAIALLEQIKAAR